MAGKKFIPGAGVVINFPSINSGSCARVMAETAESGRARPVRQAAPFTFPGGSRKYFGAAHAGSLPGDLAEHFARAGAGSLALSLWGNGFFSDASSSYLPPEISRRIPEVYTRTTMARMLRLSESGIDPMTMTHEELGLESRERLDDYLYLWSEYKEAVRACGMDPDDPETLAPLNFQNIKDEVAACFEERLARGRHRASGD